MRDGIERHYTFTRIGSLPLILNVALSTKTVEAEWRVKALVIGSIVSLLRGLTITLSLLFGRELRRREAAQVELERLSMTDALTGLPNRRAFEDAGVKAWEHARDHSASVALLIVDADHFKRINDHYGHQIGDEVLKGLARALSASVHRPQDLVCRVGGEEFAVLLPDTERSGALRIAEKIHGEISALSVSVAGIGAGAITVSIGLAALTPRHAEAAELTYIYRLADGALYEAKAGGRNQTRCARPQGLPINSQKRLLQVVSGT